MYAYMCTHVCVNICIFPPALNPRAAGTGSRRSPAACFEDEARGCKRAPLSLSLSIYIYIYIYFVYIRTYVRMYVCMYVCTYVM